MALIVHGRTGRVHSLGAQVILGRGPACTIRLHGATVSGEHAVVRWMEEGRWELRDLMSRNGTFIDDRRLNPGGRVVLREGSQLRFGDEADVWVVTDPGPPRPMATAVDNGARARATGGVMHLPDDEHPELVVFEIAEGRWIAEGERVQFPVQDQQVVPAGRRFWRLHLPVAMEKTDEARPSLAGAARLRFQISADEEHVSVTLERREDRVELGARSFHYLLLTLARHRLADADLPEQERGWVYADELARRLRLDRRTMNVHISRIRRQLDEVGLPCAAAVVERRPGSGQVRLGTIEVVLNQR